MISDGGVSYVYKYVTKYVTKPVIKVVTVQAPPVTKHVTRVITKTLTAWWVAYVTPRVETDDKGNVVTRWVTLRTEPMKGYTKKGSVVAPLRGRSALPRVWVRA